MALRFSSKNAAVAVAGTVFTHSITVAAVATAPDEWAFNHRGAPPAGNVCTLYLVAAPGTTSMTVASSSGATTADIFCSLQHTIIN